MTDEIKRTINPNDTQSGNLICGRGSLTIMPPTAVCVDREEYERLKKLDENVKRKISFLKQDIEELELIDISQSIIDDVREQLSELESLYE